MLNMYPPPRIVRFFRPVIRFFSACAAVTAGVFAAFAPNILQHHASQGDQPSWFTTAHADYPDTGCMSCSGDSGDDDDGGDGSGDGSGDGGDGG